MGFFSKLLGDTTATPITAVGKVITSIFGDKTEKLSGRAK